MRLGRASTGSPAAVTVGSLAFVDLRVSYHGREVLAGVSEEIRPGEWLGVIGPNGAGKSTLARALVGLVPYRGRVVIDDGDAGHLGRRDFARRVAYVPQQPTFPAAMNATQYVALGRTPYHGYLGADSDLDWRRGAQLLERFGVARLATRTLGEMSGGELQRLVLARALAQAAPILVLDEPTSALDLGRRVEALELIDEMRVERGLTIVSVLHDLTLAAQFASRLLLVCGGVAVARGAPDVVLSPALLTRYFGVGVDVLRSAQGHLVVAPRRTRSATARE